MALSPAKSIPMNGFMLYMSGNSIQIFSILVTVMLLFNSMKAIMGTYAAFDRFRATGTDKEGSPTTPAKQKTRNAVLADPLLMPMIAFAVLNAANLALGVWKCGAMGLLPTASSDWMAFLDPKQVRKSRFYI